MTKLLVERLEPALYKDRLLGVLGWEREVEGEWFSCSSPHPLLLAFMRTPASGSLHQRPSVATVLLYSMKW